MERIKQRKFPKVKDLADALGLVPLLDVSMDSEIRNQSIYRVGYELNGFFSEGEELLINVNVLGKKEIGYLERMDAEKR
ncbi:MAG: hypothetical protein ACRCZH_05720, partial [Cetobacterium sp.]